MAEIKCVGHLGNKAANQLGIAAIAVAGKDQSIATEALTRAVAAQDLDAADAAVRIRYETFGRALGQDDNLVCFRCVAQAIDQLPPGAAGQPMHA